MRKFLAFCADAFRHGYEEARAQSGPRNSLSSRCFSFSAMRPPFKRPQSWRKQKTMRLSESP